MWSQCSTDSPHPDCKGPIQVLWLDSSVGERHLLYVCITMCLFDRERRNDNECVCMREAAAAPLTVHVTGVTGDMTLLIVYLTDFGRQTGLLEACGEGWTAKGHPDTALITQDKDLNRTAGKGSLNSPLGAINIHFLRFTHRHIKRAKCYEASDGKVITALLTRWSVMPLRQKQICSVNINIELKVCLNVGRKGEILPVRLSKSSLTPLKTSLNCWTEKAKKANISLINWLNHVL